MEIFYHTRKEGAKGLILLAPAVCGRQVLLTSGSTYLDAALVTFHIEGDFNRNRCHYPTDKPLSLDVATLASEMEHHGPKLVSRENVVDVENVV